MCCFDCDPGPVVYTRVPPPVYVRQPTSFWNIPFWSSSNFAPGPTHIQSRAYGHASYQPVVVGNADRRPQGVYDRSRPAPGHYGPMLNPTRVTMGGNVQPGQRR